jgi:hypothetical protein
MSAPRRPSPLWRRAPTRLLHAGTWGVLVVAAFLLLTSAAAAVPMFTAAARNASLALTLRAVPPNALASESAVVRLNGGRTPTADRQRQLLAELTRIPGLSRPVVSGGSVGNEVAPYGSYALGFVGAGGKAVPARLYGQDDLGATLVPAAGSPTVARAGSGVWLPRPVATELGVRPGDQVVVGLQSPKGSRQQAVRLAGTYEVGADGRRPLDPPGSHRWAHRGGLLPLDTSVGGEPAYLVVDDIPATQRLADNIGDTLFWGAEADLDPAVPSLDSAARTAAGVAELKRTLLNPSAVDVPVGPLRTEVVSGVPTLVDRARSVAAAAEIRTRTAAWAGVALGLAAVLAVAVLGVGRRRAELRLDAGLGIRTGSVAVSAVVESLPAALLAVVGGTAAGAALVSLAGPPGPTTRAAVVAGVRAALVAAGAGLAVVLVVSWLSALAATRPVRPGAARRLPWEVLLAVVAGTAAVGLLGRASSGAAGPGTLDLLVPLLVLAAVGAVGGRLVLGAGSRVATRSRAVGPGRPSLWLATKRLAGLGDDRLLVVTLLTAGLGMLGYAVAASTSVATTAADRVAVLSGARAQAQIGASWQLDPSAPKAPTQKDIAKQRPLPVVDDPRLPSGDTVVWRRTTTVPSLFGYQGLLVIDPPSFATAASWGRGPELAGARALLPTLDAAGHEAARRFDVGDTTTPVPVLVTKGSGLRRGDVASIAGAGWVVAVRVLDVVDAFPGHVDDTPLLIAPSDGFFAHLGAGDPRYRPAPDVQDPSPTFTAYAWSTGGTAALDRLLGAAHVTPESTASDAQTRQLPEFVATRWGVGYLGALGAGLALLSIVGLALYADRNAVRSRASDVVLARLGLGRRGVRRSHALELALLVVTALLLAVVGGWVVTRLGPLGLDPGAARAPSFRLVAGPGALAGAVLAGGVALLAAVAVVRARGRDASDGTVLRDAE